MDAIDLTLSDSDEDVRPVKRQRRSSPDDDVQVIEKPPTQAPAAAGPEPTLGDEDLLITRATGPVWNEDLPHSRSQCGKHGFLTLASTRNREHCSKCFCYICDVEADKCKQWGSGSSSLDHCNAHGGRQIYQDMRTRARAAGPAVATPAPNASPGWLQRIHNSVSSSAAGPSAPASAERRHSSGPARSVGPSATSSHLRASGGASRAAFHCRTDCLDCRFQPIPSVANQRTCKMCTCFICEVSVSLCKRWGTGEERAHHCNAHAGEQRYRMQREAFRHRPLLKAHPDPAEVPWPPAPSSPPPARYPYPFNDDSDEEEDEEFDPEREAMKVVMAVRRSGLSDSHGSPSANRLPPPKKPMQPVERSNLLPNPALDDKLLELGTIRLPIRAKAPYTVADLQERVIANGIGSRIHEEYTHPTLITIHNILYNPMVEMLPLLHMVHGCEPTPMRTRRVTIVGHDGGAKPLTIGVSVHKEAPMADVLAAVKQNPAASCNPGEELVMAYCAGDKDQPFTRAYMISDMSTKTHDRHAERGYVAFRVPCNKPAKADSKGWISPTRLVVYNRMRNPEDGYPEWVATAHTILLEVSGDLWKGGRAAEKQVAAMVATALTPHRKANAPQAEPHDCFSLVRCCQSGYTSHGGKRVFSQAVQGHREYPVSESIDSGVMYLAANWKPCGLTLYDTESWSQPQVHDSASPEIIAETERLIKEEEAAKKEKKSREQRPKDLVSELSSTCRTYLPDQIKLAKRSHHTLKHPSAACKLAILCEEEAPEDCAVLQIQVYVYKTHGSYNRSFFQSPDSWLPISNKERRQYPESKHALKEVMEYFLMDDPVAKAMREELKACAEKMRGSAPYSVTALMKWLQAEERPEAPQPAGLTVDLHPYQRQSLRFMIDNEQGEGGHRRHFWVPYKTPTGFTFWWSPLFNRASREMAPCPWGGFLAEEMGCGKTVEILALILSNPAPPNRTSGSVLPDGYIVSRATLVVCAVSLVGQWMEEAKSKLNGSLRMYQYHGQGRNRDALTLATSYDLVVTTYQTLGSDWRMYNKKGSNTDGRFQPLGQIKWHRVVLDESHTVKAGGTQQTSACCELKADRRWCCSGTPISTEVSEFVGQFKFLGCQPFDNKNYFGSHIKPAWASGGWQSTGGAVNLLYALSRTLIRHTQQQRLGGATVCKLPEKTEEAIAVEFSEAEQRLYTRVHKEAKAEFQKYANGGSMMVARNLLAIMSLLSPLRAICSGGLLRERDVRVPNKDEDDQVPNGVDPNLVAPLEECSICLNHDMERPCRTPCLHWFCRKCITAELAVREKCPLCRTELQVAQLVEGVSAAREEDEEGVAAAGSSAASQPVVSESKLRALLKELADMRERDPTAKALIFTQFNSTLEWLMARLTEEGYSYRTISGSMPLKKRSQAIDAFQRDPPTTVFLLSMRSGAVGINLTAANHVFILEPAMNPALEDQAVGRAFRMGQTRPVTVKKLYIKGSVEERIMELVKDRREGRATGAAAAQPEYDEDTGRRVQKSKLRQQDVAGSIRMDRQDLRMAELQLLFQDPDFTGAAGADQAAAYNAAPAAPACGGSA